MSPPLKTYPVLPVELTFLRNFSKSTLKVDIIEIKLNEISCVLSALHNKSIATKSPTNFQGQT